MDVSLSSLILQVIILVGILLISATLHEAMHAFTSNWLGDDTAYHAGRLTLNPLAHIDPLLSVVIPLLLFIAGLPPIAAAKPVPFNPYRLKYDEFGAALVGIAGPLTNLALAIVVGFWTRFVVGANSGLASEILTAFVVVNLGLFVFNLIPFPPLDGSRLLYALAPEGLRSLLRQIEQAGIMAVILFYFVAFSALQPLIVGAVRGLASWILGTSNVL